MAMTTSDRVLRRFGEELEALRGNWGWFMALGIALILLGLIGLSAPLLFTLGSVMVFGVLLLVGGVVEIGSAFWAGRWSGLALHLLAGILYLVVGLFMVERPGLAAAGFTLALAVFFFVGGLFRIVIALIHRFPNWGGMLISGIVNLVLGILIWRDWPEASFVVIGLFVGIEMLFNGFSWLMLALAVRRVPSER